MNCWFTSDLHFGHKNIIKYANRPFANVEEMNAALIKNWNELVKPEDYVYVLGDVSFMRMKDTLNILQQLNGKKGLICPTGGSLNLPFGLFARIM